MALSMALTIFLDKKMNQLGRVLEASFIWKERELGGPTISLFSLLSHNFQLIFLILQARHTRILPKMRHFLPFLSLLSLAHPGVKAQDEDFFNFGPDALSYLGAKQTCIESTGSSPIKRCFYTYIPECAGQNSPLVFDIHGYVYHYFYYDVVMMRRVLYF